jgi:pimeloyl-ACP methyl ester carboxylesterase
VQAVRTAGLTTAASFALLVACVSAAPGASAEGTTTQRQPRPAATAAAAASAAAAAKVIDSLPACSDPFLASLGARCGSVVVPLDYRHPRTGTVRIAVSVVKHSAPNSQYQGINLVNPGGPGGSGLHFSVLGKLVPDGAGDTYDWVGFDPRGVGASTPALSCIADHFAGPRPIYEPFTPATEKAWLARSKAYANACGRNGGSLLPNLTTADSARDLDRIREFFGQQQLNYYGFSYGTYLGQVYATLFPSKVRRFVLDSNVDPRLVWYSANLAQDYAFERNERVWWAWLARYDSVYHLGKTEKDVRDRWYAERAELAERPAGGVVGASEWSDVFLAASYNQLTWLPLADLWTAWNARHADPKPLIDAYSAAGAVGNDNSFSMYLGVQCVDAPWPRDWSVWRRDSWRAYPRAPFATWNNTWFNAPCAFWPAKGHRPVEVNGEHVAPILLVGETLDAATPFGGSLVVRRLFPNSRLLTLPNGTNHAMSLFGNPCEDSLIAAYLADGTLPARARGEPWDATCAPLPEPAPAASVPAASGGMASAGIPSSAGSSPTRLREALAAVHLRASRFSTRGGGPIGSSSTPGYLLPENCTRR